MDVLEISLKILREAGLPSLCVIAALYFIYRIGTNARDAVVWMGPRFALPIRDAFIENIGVLTRFVMRADELLPQIHSTQERICETVSKTNEQQEKIAYDVDGIKRMAKAMSVVISHQCDAEDCYFKKNRKQFDSDLPPGVKLAD